MKLNRRQLRRLIESALNENQELLGKETGLGGHNSSSYRHIINKIKEVFRSKYDSLPGRDSSNFEITFRNGTGHMKGFGAAVTGTEASADDAYLDISFEEINYSSARREVLERQYKEIRDDIASLSFRVDGLPVQKDGDFGTFKRADTIILDKPVTIVLEPAHDKIKVTDFSRNGGGNFFDFTFKMKIYAQK